MSGRVIFEGAENLVAALLVKWSRLEAVRLQRRRKAAALNSIILRRLEQPSTVALAPRGRIHPENFDMQSAAPDLTDQPAQPFPAQTLQEETGRVVGRKARRSQIMSNELVDDQPAQGLCRQRIE